MLQPEIFRTLDIIYNSLHWLDDLSNEDLFGVDSGESDKLGALRGGVAKHEGSVRRLAS
jgi:hypothetical protein